MLLAEKDELTRLILSEEEGKLDEYLLEQWRGNELELKDKIDGYGWVLDNIATEIDRLKALKDIHNKRLKNAVDRFENEKERLKKRLYEHCEGKALRGNEYSFHPYIGQTQTVDMEQVEPDYKKYTLPKLSFEEMKHLMIILSVAKGLVSQIPETPLTDSLLQKAQLATTSCGVSDLPDGHPALSKQLRYDVRIT